MDEQILIYAAILVAVIVLTIVGILSRYRKCKSDEVLVVYGKTGDKKSAKLYHGGAAFVWPIIQGYSFLNMKPMQIDCKLTGAISKQNIRVDVPTTITVAVSTEPEVMQNAAERLLGLNIEAQQELIKDVVYGQMRLVIADMTIEQLNSDRDTFLENCRKNIDSELKKFGLYLMNINITERTKEIATIKVLGFFEREVEAYVYRESNVLTVIGMLLGLVGGIFLHMFIMRTVEVDMVMFGRDIKPLSFVLSAVLTVVFSLLVNLGMKRKLRNISMVESMKAPE